MIKENEYTDDVFKNKKCSYDPEIINREAINKHFADKCLNRADCTMSFPAKAEKSEFLMKDILTANTCVEPTAHFFIQYSCTTLNE